MMLVVCSGTEEVEARRRWAAKGGAGWGRETYLALDCSHLEGAVGLAAQTRTSRPHQRCYRQALPCKAARVPRWAARGGSSSCDLGPGAWGHEQAMLHVWRLCRGARRRGKGGSARVSASKQALSCHAARLLTIQRHTVASSRGPLHLRTCLFHLARCSNNTHSNHGVLVNVQARIAAAVAVLVARWEGAGIVLAARRWAVLMVVVPMFVA